MNFQFEMVWLSYASVYRALQWLRPWAGCGICHIPGGRQMEHHARALERMLRKALAVLHCVVSPMLSSSVGLQLGTRAPQAKLPKLTVGCGDGDSARPG